jgi:protein-disulfide isomerase
MPSQRLNSLLTIVSVSCAVAVTALLIRRELAPDPRRSNAPVRLSAEDWNKVSEGGEVLGPPDAPVRIVVFADFQCPACRDFALGPLQQILTKHREAVQVRFRHWPLPYHPLAESLAAQAHCAGRQQRFWAYHDILFSVQDSVSRFQADSLARLARIPNMIEWRACVSDASIGREIASESALAKFIKGQGTPTVVVNGYRYLGYPDLEELERLVARGRR